jgi:hypothetical protein
MRASCEDDHRQNICAVSVNETTACVLQHSHGQPKPAKSLGYALLPNMPRKAYGLDLNPTSTIEGAKPGVGLRFQALGQLGLRAAEPNTPS